MSAKGSKYSPGEEKELMGRLWAPQIADDPEKFVLFAFPWGQVGTPLEKFSGPRRWQRAVLRKVAEHIRTGRAHEALDLPLEMLRMSRVSGRGIGKSALVCWLILWFLTTRIGGSVIVSANTESQLRTVTWGELTKWVALVVNSHWWDISATKLAPKAWLTELVEDQLKKGTRQWAAEGKLWSEENPDAYAGPHNMLGMMLIFDEASGIVDPIWPVAAGYFTEAILDRYWLAFSNGRRNDGYFYECHEGPKRAFWDANSIDARDVEGTDAAYYEKIMEEYGPDSDEARIEVYGQFPVQGDEQFFSPSAIDEAMKREPWNDATAHVVMGVDPSRGGDTTVIVVRRGRDMVAKIRFKEGDLMDVVGRVAAAINEYNPLLTNIDEGGLGAGVVDRLKEQGYAVRGVNFGWKSSKSRVYGNKRAEMYGECREWLRTASIRPDQKLKSDLLAIKRKTVGSKGQIFLATKEDMGFSPDDADALVLTFAVPMAYIAPPIDRMTHSPYPELPGPISWMAR